MFGGEIIKAGSIIVRQRGTKFFPGKNTGLGRDHSIFALITGRVTFTEKNVKKYDSRMFKDKFINVEPLVSA